MFKPHIFSSISDLTNSTGLALGPTSGLKISDSMIVDFARLTMDSQAIHLDPEVARQAGFNGPIAHGYLLLALLSQYAYQLYEVQNCGPIINYGLDKVRFIRPVEAGDTIYAAALIQNTSQKQAMTLVHVDFELKNQHGHAVMFAEAITGLSAVAE